MTLSRLQCPHLLFVFGDYDCVLSFTGHEFMPGYRGYVVGSVDGYIEYTGGVPNILTLS